VLTKLLKLLESHPGEIDQDQLCTELKITPDTLQNLLDLLVRKGRITPQQAVGALCAQTETCLTNGKTCPGPEECNLVMLAPRQISFTLRTNPK
jgi:hypothetical protein